MELKQNLLWNYKENKRIGTNNEIKNLFINRDNEIFGSKKKVEVCKYNKQN